MNRETQLIEKKRHIPLWNTKKVVKKDILLIPAYIFFQSIIPIIVVFGTLGITAMITQHAPPAWFYNLSLSISFVLAQGLVLMLFFALHKFYIASVASRQFKNAKKYVRQILIVVMITFVLMLLIEWFVQWLPASLRFSATQYERRVEGLFLHPIALCFTFISMVILRPMIEQLIYRHIIIHELGKKWNKKIMIVISIVIESIVHTYDMASIFEIIPYLLIASGATYLYIRTGQNLAVAYLYQVGVQCFIFLEILSKVYIF
ncbi:CPBP family lipoprotein N-acylation protein LnsB [Staphylococcus capitis]|uniref:CPBP family lipoprotein N-acylation protein LnsB n=1 Tax=Staphylococcus capitis TaxID=29388 RepID=UPI002F260AC6